jgi:glutamate N-acetyltransferase/amino-acid N-acetyltransferase
MVTKKHLRSGKARAILVNSGIANVGVEKGEKEAEKVSGMLWRKLHIEASETVIASTGAITGVFPSDKIIEKADALIEGLGVGEEYSLSVARAMMTADKKPKQLAFSFEIGDYVCKIGAVFKGAKRVYPNMATTLCFLTTDVAIDSEYLQKALSFSVSETLN